MRSNPRARIESDFVVSGPVLSLPCAKEVEPPRASVLGAQFLLHAGGENPVALRLIFDDELRVVRKLYEE
jgi:hypothetical protein